jgi:hypothetical protein
MIVPSAPLTLATGVRYFLCDLSKGDAGAPLGTKRTEAANNTERKRVLVVDDEVLIADSVAQNYGGRDEGNRTFGYIGMRKKCGPC